MALTRTARRWIAGGVAAIAVIAALLAGEAVSRAVIQRMLDQAAPTGVQISPSSESTVWGLLTGSLGVAITIDERALASARQEGVHEVWIDDRLHVTVARSTPFGEIPVELTLVPVVTAGELAVEVVKVDAGGIALPPGLVGTDFSFDKPSIGDRCLELHDAAVQDGRLVLHGTIPAGLRGAQVC